MQTKMAEKEHIRWTDIVSAKETQLQNIQEWVGQLEAGLEEAKRDILPQLRTHKVQHSTHCQLTHPSLTADTPFCRGRLL